MIFPSKRRKVAIAKKREVVSAQSNLSSVVYIAAEGNTVPLPPAASQSNLQKVEVEVIDESDEALVAQESVHESCTLVRFYIFSIIFIDR